MLVVFGGLPGTGKTTIARRLSERLGAAHVRVDSITAAMSRGGIDREQPTGLASYLVAEAVAEECLCAGTPVVIDAVNPVEAARRQWHELAARTGATLRVVELVCPDEDEHRRRLESREEDLAGDRPTWADVMTREYEPWDEPRLVVDTRVPLKACLARIDRYLGTW
jgi:predicted kinase